MFRMIQKRLRNQKGFTLVELMVVVVIIGILVGIAVPAYKKVTGTAERNTCWANQRSIEGTLQLYFANEGKEKLFEEVEGTGDDGKITLEDLEGKLVGETDESYFNELPTCPSDGDYLVDNDGGVSCTDPAHDRVEKDKSQ